MAEMVPRISVVGQVPTPPWSTVDPWAGPCMLAAVSSGGNTAAAAAAVTAGVMIGQQTAAKATRDALFLSAGELPGKVIMPIGDAHEIQRQRDAFVSRSATHAMKQQR